MCLTPVTGYSSCYRTRIPITKVTCRDLCLPPANNSSYGCCATQKTIFEFTHFFNKANARPTPIYTRSPIPNHVSSFVNVLVFQMTPPRGGVVSNPNEVYTRSSACVPTVAGTHAPGRGVGVVGWRRWSGDIISAVSSCRRSCHGCKGQRQCQLVETLTPHMLR